MKLLFFVDMEVRASDENADMPKNLKGAFVNCYVFSKDEVEAVEKVKRALSEDFYEVVKMNECYRIDESQFFSDSENEDGEPTQSDIEDIRNSGDVFYGKFFGYADD